MGAWQNSAVAALEDVVGERQYPGRGLAIGLDHDGVPFAAYWLTGRSLASQQRQIAISEREIVIRDLSGSSVDDLRHYTAATRGDDWIVIGNGRHVSDLTNARAAGTDVQLAARHLAYEPDPPIRTPRIYASATIAGTRMREVVAGSAKSYADGRVQHPSLYLAEVEPGSAVTTSTYGGSATEIVADGQPRAVNVQASWTSIPDTLWDVLDPVLRVAVVVIPLAQPTFLEAVSRAR